MRWTLYAREPPPPLIGLITHVLTDDPRTALLDRPRSAFIPCFLRNRDTLRHTDRATHPDVSVQVCMLTYGECLQILTTLIGKVKLTGSWQAQQMFAYRPCTGLIHSRPLRRVLADARTSANTDRSAQAGLAP